MRRTGEVRLGFRKWFVKIPRLIRSATRYNVATAQRSEGSRFVTGQFYRMPAGGSREQPSVTLAPSVSLPRPIDSYAGHRNYPVRRAVPGSRLQQSHRTATRQSGSPPGVGHAPPRALIRGARTKRLAGLSLIELLVVITIIALVSALITTSVLSALNQQNQRVCLNNMLTIEAAKDEYLRDHPGATSVPSIPDFQPYFRFGIPQCPDNAGTNYQNLLSLTQQVYCPKHPENQQKLSAAPSPANN